MALELNDRDKALRHLKYNLNKAQEQTKVFADRKRRDIQFQVGEWVLLKLRPHKQHSVV